jgi:DNA-binding response OmpR family regulator
MLYAVRTKSGQGYSTMKLILVVEDSLVSQSLLDEILSDSYRLAFETDGASGIAAARRHRPDLILLDIKMPGMDGYEVCSILKGDEETADIPIIFITSLDTESEKVRGFAVGADDYVVKPFFRQELIARINAHISLRESRKQALTLTRLTVFKEMAVAISHEINNPLTTVYAYLHILQKGVTDPSESTRTALAGIKEEIVRIQTIVGKLAESTKAPSVPYSKDVSMIDLHNL